MKAGKVKLLLIMLIWPTFTCLAQQEIPLYAGDIPNSKNVPDRELRTPNAVVDTVVTHVSVPTITIFEPTDRPKTRTAVIICPGGGYGSLCINMEGKKVARAFNKLGITAFVLKYRLPDDSAMHNKEIVPLQDAQQAIRMVRHGAQKWGIDPQKIGIMGFSAGGHLASTAGTHFDSPVDEDTTNVRPDFMILIYPVISFTDSIGHIGSRTNLLGPSPTNKQVEFFSNELHINAFTPPTFLTHAEDDTVVPLANTMTFFKALNKNKISASTRIFSKGEHGYLNSPPFDEWFGSCAYWLKEMDLL